MIISKIKIKKVMPDKGLVGFASCVIDDCLYLGNIAIFTRLEHPDKIRLVFPAKDVGENKIDLFHPLTAELYFALEEAISNSYWEQENND